MSSGDELTAVERVIHAIWQNDLVALERIVTENKALLGPLDSEKRTPLHHAISNECLEAAEILLKAGADINAIGYGMTPLCIAAANADLEAARFLVEHGARLDIKHDGHNMLPYCVRDRATGDYLLAAGMTLEYDPERSMPVTCWHYSSGRTDMALYFLEKGVSVDEGGVSSEILLTLAIEKDDVSFTRELLARGANSNREDYFGDTPLLGAAHKGNADIFQLMIDHGADWRTDPTGMGPVINAAAARGNFEIVKILLDAGEDVNRRGLDGNTVLCSAATLRENTGLIRFLVSRGADIDAKNNDGKTALDLADSRQYVEIAEYLKEEKQKRVYNSTLSAINRLMPKRPKP